MTTIPWFRPVVSTRDEVTERFVRAMWHWLRSEEPEAEAWTRAALYCLPDLS